MRKLAQLLACRGNGGSCFPIRLFGQAPCKYPPMHRKKTLFPCLKQLCPRMSQPPLVIALMLVPVGLR